MQQPNSPYNRIRFVYKRSSTLTKVLVLSAVVLSTVTLLGLRHRIQKTEAQIAATQSQLAREEQENAKLEQKIEALGTLNGAMQIAKDELGYEDPDTIILEPES